MYFVKNSGFAREDVYNCDNTGINWKALPGKSLAFRQEKVSSGFKVSKKHITAMVCANATGEHALSLLVIENSKKPRCFKNVMQLPLTWSNATSPELRKVHG